MLLTCSFVPNVLHESEFILGGGGIVCPLDYQLHTGINNISQQITHYDKQQPA